jgi:ankyrin repeat protein
MKKLQIQPKILLIAIALIGNLQAISPVMERPAQERMTTGGEYLESDIYAMTPNKRGQLLKWAAYDAKLATLQMLIKCGADVNAKDEGGSTPLHSAAHLSSALFRPATEKYIAPAIARALLDAGANVHARDERGFTALMWAAFGSNEENSDIISAEIITLLLNAGAEVNARTLDGHTALSIAYSQKQTEIISLLLGRGAIKQ